MESYFIKSFLLFFSSLYTLHFTTNDGVDTSMSAYQGKKMLIVNIATGSEKADQLAQLQELHEQYHDRLTIICFPSNSFGNEPREDSDIKQFCDSAYHPEFTIAEKGSVTGANSQPIYSWLGNQSENGVLEGDIIGDYQKFLIDEDGSIIGVFAPTVSPLDSSIINAIVN